MQKYHENDASLNAQNPDGRTGHSCDWPGQPMAPAASHAGRASPADKGVRGHRPPGAGLQDQSRNVEPLVNAGAIAGLDGRGAPNGAQRSIPCSCPFVRRTWIVLGTADRLTAPQMTVHGFSFFSRRDRKKHLTRSSEPGRAGCGLRVDRSLNRRRCLTTARSREIGRNPVARDVRAMAGRFECRK